MKLLIIFAISAVLLQYHGSIQTKLPKELSNYELLGTRFHHGSISDVEKAKIKRTGEQVAIKITSTKTIKIKTKQDQSKEKLIQKQIEMAHEEAKILENLLLHPHKNIVQFKEFIETEENLYLVMEYVSGVTVHEYLQENKLGGNEARVIFIQVVKAIKHCHDNGIVHRDLKTENVILLYADRINNHIKLIDFGFATNLTGGVLLHDYSRSPRFAAPEVETSEKLKSEYDGFKSDIWTLGAFLYELVCGKWPGSDSIFKHGSEEIDFPPYSEMTDGVKDLLHNILKIDPNERFTLDEIMKHDWMKTRG